MFAQIRCIFVKFKPTKRRATWEATSRKRCVGERTEHWGCLNRCFFYEYGVLFCIFQLWMLTCRKVPFLVYKVPSQEDLPTSEKSLKKGLRSNAATWIRRRIRINPSNPTISDRNTGWLKSAFTWGVLVPHINHITLIFRESFLLGEMNFHQTSSFPSVPVITITCI